MRRSLYSPVLAIVSLIALFTWEGSASAQEASGYILGTVRDSPGAVIRRAGIADGYGIPAFQPERSPGRTCRS